MSYRQCRVKGSREVVTSTARAAVTTVKSTSVPTCCPMVLIISIETIVYATTTPIEIPRHTHVRTGRAAPLNRARAVLIRSDHNEIEASSIARPAAIIDPAPGCHAASNAVAAVATAAKA